MYKTFKNLTIGLVASALISVPTFHVFAEDYTQEQKQEVDDYVKDGQQQETQMNLDDKDGNWASTELNEFVDQGIVGGYKMSDGTYKLKPNNHITRAEFAAMITRAINLQQSGSVKSFSDVSPKDWYYDVVQTVSTNDIANGKTDTTFNPNDYITRAEMAAMIQNAFKTSVDFSGSSKKFNDVDSENWASGVIENVSKAGIIDGYNDGSFGPNKLATRAEAVVMLKRALDKETKNVTVDDTTLINVVKDTEEISLWNFAYTGDYLGLMDIVKTRTTGRYSLTGPGFIFAEELLKSFNKNIELKEMGTPTYQVIKKTERKAVVQKSNSTIQSTVIDTTTNQPVASTDTDPNPSTVSGDETYFLKKDSNGNWKIFNTVSKADQEVEGQVN